MASAIRFNERFAVRGYNFEHDFSVFSPNTFNLLPFI
jgi:hypothetical protein